MTPALPAAPLMVLGAGRGGTSLLTACLRAHSALSMASEAHGAAVLMGQDFVGSHSPKRLLEERLTEFVARCERDRAAVRPHTWGNKITTEHVAGLEDHNTYNALDGTAAIDVVQAFIDALSGYRFVFIVRDGRSCALSKHRRRGMPLALAAYRWRYSIRVLRTLRRLKQLTALVRFEDLVISPEATLRQLCAALRAPFEGAMLEQTSSNSLPEHYRHAGFLAEKAIAPALPASLLEYVKSDLAYCGYSLV